MKNLEWHVSEWINTPEPLHLEALRGQVVIVCAFQMLCPGCVAQAIPQMKAVDELFSSRDVKAIGLHSVFEHHAAMTPVALKAFAHEYQIRFPLAVDAPGKDGDPMPQTMRLYQMQGTPTLMLYDRAGQLVRQIFGHIPDLQLGAEIMALLNNGNDGEP